METLPTTDDEWGDDEALTLVSGHHPREEGQPGASVGESVMRSEPWFTTVERGCVQCAAPAVVYYANKVGSAPGAPGSGCARREFG